MESSPISTILGCWFQVKKILHKIIDKGLIQTFGHLISKQILWSYT